MRFGGLNLGQNSLKVRGKGPGTKGKERIVFFGKRTGQAIWRCIVGRLDCIRPEDPVFTVGFSYLPQASDLCCAARAP